MTSFNFANVINVLVTTFQIVSITQTSIPPFEIVHNEICDILQNVQNTRVLLLLEYDYVLDFVDPSELHGAQDVEYITAAEKEDKDSFEPEEYIIDDEDGKVDFRYKRKTVQFWMKKKLVEI